VTPYVELHCHSNFSFLDGGSHPYELAMRAAELEMPALALTDHDGVYGAVRHLQACRKLGVKPIIGSALEVDGEELILIARNLRGYSNLCRLLSLAHADQPKGEARTRWWDTLVVREYWRALLNNNLLCELYRDVSRNEWFVERVFD
jgi:DNA polymerase III alpha subunit